MDDSGALFVRCGGGTNGMHDVIEDRIYNQPQRVREVTRLHRRGLVILDADEEVFVMTEEEYASQC